MPKDLKSFFTKEGRKSKLIVRLMIPMLTVAALQLVIFFAVLGLGGEFSYVEQYANHTLAEKTENRRNYIQNEMQRKTSYVYDAGTKISRLVQEILEQRGETAADLKKDKELNRQILEASVENLTDLLRRSVVNDVYLILDTGRLYSDDGGSNNAKAALYLRDLDPATDAGYEDLLMEIGYSSISQKFGIVLDSGWTLHFEPDPEKPDDYDFYYNTLQNAGQTGLWSLEDLGYWSGFSKTSRSSAASMKYSIPLIGEDGTAYGVLGIGLTENAILAALPMDDYQDDDICFVLAREEKGDAFSVVTHFGVAYNRYLGNVQTLKTTGLWDGEVCGIEGETAQQLSGSVQYLTLYDQESPYYTDRWALVGVADKREVLKPLTNLIRNLVVAALISVAASVVGIVVSAKGVVKPISAVIKTMNQKQEYYREVQFESSGIYEIDQMTDAITRLQINVREFSSQVSQMIRIANVGIGTFLYNRTQDSVFVGQSLSKLLRFAVEQNEDRVLSRQDFLSQIGMPEARQAIVEALSETPEEEQSDLVKEYSVLGEDGATVWLRLSMVRNQSGCIGILQDITGVIMEKKRIEYERDYDSITGLLNRRAFFRKVEEVFRDPGSLKVTAFIMFDLDNLKYVNDTYGHDFGDDYIKTAATAIRKFQNYGGIAGRLSGDEFLVCMPGFSSREEIKRDIRRVREDLAACYCLLADGAHYAVRASAGISWYPDDSTNYETLIRYADFAMYTVKHSGKGECAEFDMNAYRMDSVRVTSIEELNRILREESVRFAFHSILNARTGQVYGYEALMRPLSSIFQSPREILRTAKTVDRLYETERLVWKKSLADFKEQTAAGRIAEGSRLFIHSVTDSVLEPEDVETIEETYPEFLSRVVLEIRENANKNREIFDRKMARMKQWGGMVSLDEFGAGYNSEYALVALHPHIVRIDHSIISGCDRDISRRNVINNLVRLARAKNISVLAEGVETEGELRTVMACGVDLLQGYYLARPVFEPQPPDPKVTEMIRFLAGLSSPL